MMNMQPFAAPTMPGALNMLYRLMRYALIPCILATCLTGFIHSRTIRSSNEGVFHCGLSKPG
jgi:hypothetical protein